MSAQPAAAAAGAVAPAAAGASSDAKTAAKPATAAGAAGASAPAPAKEKIKTHAITMVQGFQCTTALLFDALTDERIVSTYHQSKATIDAKAGGKFVLFEGTIRGEFVSLSKQSPTQIVQKWRFNEWPDDHYSVVTMDLVQQKPGVVALTLHQTGIPEEDKYGNRDIAQKVRDGWQKFFWTRINKIVGYHNVDISKADSDDD